MEAKSSLIRYRQQKKASLNVKYSVAGFASASIPLLLSFLESDLTTICYRSSVCLILTIIFGLCLFPSNFDVWGRAVVTGFVALLGTYIIIFLWSFLKSDCNLLTICYRSSVCLILTIMFGLCLFPSYFDVWWRGVVTGFGALLGTYIIIFPELQRFWPFGTYLCILFISHFSEYAVTGITNPSNLNTDTFLLNHSLQYWIAAVASGIEYFVEFYFLPAGIKDVKYLVMCGVMVSIVGEILRKMAMFYAGHNLYHDKRTWSALIVQSLKRENHKLVTSGVFSFVRHPYYVGWFLWFLGTQIVLLNPICFCIYGSVVWVSFNKSIYDEEESLLKVFGNAYSDYQTNVPTGIPFTRGFVPNKDKSN